MSNEEKHTGQLDASAGRTHAEVEFYSMDRTQINISGGHGDIESKNIVLDAAQCLSLLSWLEQKRAYLEAVAKEQA